MQVGSPSEIWGPSTSSRRKSQCSGPGGGVNELGVLEGRNARGLGAHVKGREECMGWGWGLDMGALLQGSWYGVCI